MTDVHVRPRAGSLLATLGSDLAAFVDRDPAALGRLDVMCTASGFHALVAHRLAHQVWVCGARRPAKLLATAARWATGVEIHPAARLGPGAMIDHGSGVVIGETVEVGAGVSLYQGVTLGGTSTVRGKRHPTLGDHVTVGAGAKVLGAVTVGDRARIGANSVVTKDVPADAVVVGVPGQMLTSDADRFDAQRDSGVDVVTQRLDVLTRRLVQLENAAGMVGTPGPVPDADGVWRAQDFTI